MTPNFANTGEPQFVPEPELEEPAESETEPEKREDSD